MCIKNIQGNLLFYNIKKNFVREDGICNKKKLTIVAKKLVILIKGIENC